MIMKRFLILVSTLLSVCSGCTSIILHEGLIGYGPFSEPEHHKDITLHGLVTQNYGDENNVIWVYEFPDMPFYVDTETPTHLEIRLPANQRTRSLSMRRISGPQSVTGTQAIMHVRSVSKCRNRDNFMEMRKNSVSEEKRTAAVSFHNPPTQLVYAMPLNISGCPADVWFEIPGSDPKQWIHYRNRSNLDPYCWTRRFMRLGYIITVPFDVITMPLQLVGAVFSASVPGGFRASGYGP